MIPSRRGTDARSGSASREVNNLLHTLRCVKVKYMKPPDALITKSHAEGSTFDIPKTYSGQRLTCLG